MQWERRFSFVVTITDQAQLLRSAVTELPRLRRYV